ncbi:ABC transporter permease [Amycolatopsis sp.]|uniref:ABC transporter permease n=1 Tax=Amycolatopsis sp. TaxID=37632 RepID=UPI002BE45499|nr:ABC transporter permease [Amycolatopsis sp.]HVV11194.1 ABC transporter permease [Amycolatopsis sp.]
MTLRYFVTRILQGLVVVLGAVLISFLLTNVIGKPSDVIGGPFLTADQRAALNVQLGYDRPLFYRFMHYISRIFVGDFGVSYRTNQGAISSVLTALPNTLILVLVAIVVAVFVGLALAMLGARRPDMLGDRVVRRTIGVLQGVPDFWLGLMLILLFSVKLGKLPSFGFYGPSSIVLPAATLALPVIPIMYRLFRGQLLEVLSSEFVEAMHSRAISTNRIMFRHALRGILGPASNYIALQLGYLISGSIIVETIFSWPGIGNLVVSAVLARDFVVVQAIIIVVALFYVLLNLIADVIMFANDPRVRAGG